jgi:hypothetical protein
MRASRSLVVEAGVCPETPCSVFREESRVFAGCQEGDGFAVDDLEYCRSVIGTDAVTSPE